MSYTVKTLEVAGTYIYSCLEAAQLDELSDIYYQSIESVFRDAHRDYAQMAFQKLSPTFLGRAKDLENYSQILPRVGDANPHFRNLLMTEIEKLKIIIEQKKQL